MNLQWLTVSLATILRAGLLVAGCSAGLTADVLAQGNVLATARATAEAGDRAEALRALEAHLAVTPDDVDARLLYGLVLSWEKRYDEARHALNQVLVRVPHYLEARVGLMNVEYWSGNADAALAQADQVLASHPGNTAARAVRDRLEASSGRAWFATASYTLDTFDDGTEPWHERSLYVTRLTVVGPAIVRVSDAERLGKDDQLVEGEFYPRFGPGRYAYVGGAVSSRADLYPSFRLGCDWYQSLGGGFEVSGGMRYLDFDTVTRIYVGTVSKYVHNWMLTAKVYRVPGEGDVGSTTYHAGARRYHGAHGTNYLGLVYSHGFSREEIYSVSDLATLNAHAVRAEFDQWLGQRMRVFGFVGAGGRQEADRTHTIQATVSLNISARF